MPERNGRPYFSSPMDYGDDANNNTPRSISEDIDRGRPSYFLYDQISGKKIGHVDNAGKEHFTDEQEVAA